LVVTGESLSSQPARTGAAGAVRAAGALLEVAERGAPLIGLDGVEYAAPEVNLGESVDARATVYAVGVRLYELLAGRRPFEGRSRGEIVSAHLLKEPAPLDADPALAAVVMKALAKKRDERWESPAAMRVALEGLALPDDAAAPEPAPAEAEPPRAPEPTRRIEAQASRPEVASALEPPRRGRVALVAGGALLLLALGWAFLRPERRPDGGPTEVEAAMQRGDLGAARAEAERRAKDHPHDGGAFAGLGHVLFAQGEKERALAAYREAFHLDRAVGASPELLANLRATFADPVHGEAAFRLTEAIGGPAESILSDLAAGTSDARLKRRAAEAMGRIRTGETR
jgi:hypothetical protein